jgi:hypothetical protein
LLLQTKRGDLVAEDCVLKEKASHILERRRRQKHRFSRPEINGVPRRVPFCELSPLLGFLNEGDVVLASTFALRIYFRVDDTAGLGAPDFEESPLLARTISFADAASIRSIWA